MGAGRRVFSQLLVAALLGAAGAGTVRGGQNVSLAATGPDGRPAAGVVAFLADVRTPAVQPPVVVDQRHEAFVPAISVVQAGSDAVHQQRRHQPSIYSSRSPMPSPCRSTRATPAVQRARPGRRSQVQHPRLMLGYVGRGLTRSGVTGGWAPDPADVPGSTSRALTPGSTVTTAGCRHGGDRRLHPASLCSS
jgi:hypothetical protein